MPFTALFIATAPDADPEVHRAVIDTGVYKLFTVVARDHEQALDLCRTMVPAEGVHSILLCPGHSHRDVGEIADAVGPGVSVSVARGDSRSMGIARKAMEEAGWFAAGVAQR
jgi:hypothetical protein